MEHVDFFLRGAIFAFCVVLAMHLVRCIYEYVQDSRKRLIETESRLRQFEQACGSSLSATATRLDELEKALGITKASGIMAWQPETYRLPRLDAIEEKLGKRKSKK